MGEENYVAGEGFLRRAGLSRRPGSRRGASYFRCGTLALLPPYSSPSCVFCAVHLPSVSILHSGEGPQGQRVGFIFVPLCLTCCCAQMLAGNVHRENRAVNSNTGLKDFSEALWLPQQGTSALTPSGSMGPPSAEPYSREEGTWQGPAFLNKGR